mmetsp:Transcript_22162/g.56310  ORF Transcript_22162/g.56310 Transcript_22162/m.56310 type:complete len:522 (-) Transcript_22162:24-1589(-)
MQSGLQSSMLPSTSSRCIGPCNKRQPLVQCQAAATQRKAGGSIPGQQPEKAVFLKDGRTEAFFRFCIEQLKVSTPKLKPAEFGGIRGMGASADIKPDEIIMSIPRTNAIRLSPKQSPPPGIAPEYWGKAPWFAKMGLLLLHEKSLGAQSRLAPYIEQLPQTFDAPVLWDDAQLQLLQYPHIIHAVKEQQLEWGALYEDLAARGVVPGSGRAPISQRDFLWALSAVRSRTFSGPYLPSTASDRVRLLGLVGGLVALNLGLGLADPQRTLSAALAVLLFNVLYESILSQSAKQYAMCPLIDFINHSSQYENEVTLDYFSDRYSVTAGREYRAGEQVFISYGANQTNDSLMQFYGFSEPDNPADVYTMTNMLKWMDDSAFAPDQARLDSLNSAGLLKSLQLVGVMRTGFPVDTMQALRYVLASPEEAGKGVSAFAGPGSPATEARLAALLVHACAHELKSLGTSLQDDLRLLEGRGSTLRGASGSGASRGPGLSAKERLAVAFRVEKKKVLTACLEALGGAPPS